MPSDRRDKAAELQGMLGKSGIPIGCVGNCSLGGAGADARTTAGLETGATTDRRYNVSELR
jgi:hypothetical protein